MPVYKVTSKPEGDLTTVNAAGETRPLLRQTIVEAKNKEEAEKVVDAQNWDSHVAYDEPLFKIVKTESMP